MNEQKKIDKIADYGAKTGIYGDFKKSLCYRFDKILQYSFWRFIVHHVSFGSKLLTLVIVKNHLVITCPFYRRGPSSKFIPPVRNFGDNESSKRYTKADLHIDVSSLVLIFEFSYFLPIF